jgi:H+/Cl- antiporter ClcA
LARLWHVKPADFWETLRSFGKWLVLGAGVGVMSGTASAIFLIWLDWATRVRLGTPALLLALPGVGYLIGWVYHRFAGTAARGSNLIVEELHENRARVPLRMAPLILVGTVLTHLVGGSAGREGTAVQMGASLADALRRWLPRSDRRLLLMAGISGGFGSVFGTPMAGVVFALEVQSIGRVWYDGLFPCLVAALVGDLVTRAWGVTHAHYPPLPALPIDPILGLKVALASVAFGLTSLLFVELLHIIKRVMPTVFPFAPIRPVVGGALVIGLTLLVGTSDFLGLSLPLIQHSLDGSGVATLAFLGKLIFTAVTLGTGFVGGEVTPLFVMGATLGYTLGGILGVDPGWLASIGFVAVFAGASNTPLACLLMGVELFGGGSLLYLGIGCFVAYLASGHRSIYTTQRISVPKVADSDVQPGDSLDALHHRRPTRWPQRTAAHSTPSAPAPTSDAMPGPPDG